jgi:hypothetical protein
MFKRSCLSNCKNLEIFTKKPDFGFEDAMGWLGWWAAAPPPVDGSCKRWVRWNRLATAHIRRCFPRPGAPPAALAAPAHFPENPLLEIQISAWAFRRGGGAAAGCEALRPPHPCP